MKRTSIFLIPIIFASNAFAGSGHVTDESAAMLMRTQDQLWSISTLLQNQTSSSTSEEDQKKLLEKIQQLNQATEALIKTMQEAKQVTPEEAASLLAVPAVHP